MEIAEAQEASAAEQFALIGGWGTDFRRRAVSLTEFEAVLAKDRIPPIDAPQFSPVARAPGYMRPDEPVIAVSIGPDARAYPLAILMWHEIVNDTVGGTPFAITFCPLCNSALVFERSVGGRTLSFGTTGLLRHSDLVMWDRQTQSWWQQITGEALVGRFMGEKLAVFPSSVISWSEFVRANPNGKVLDRLVRQDGSPVRPYDDPPYAGYDSVDDRPFLFSGPLDGRLRATARVLAVETGGASVAYPFEFLRSQGVVNDRVGGEDLVVMFDPALRSAFNDASSNVQIAGGATVFSRRLAGKFLTFRLVDGVVQDADTGSAWSPTGLALSGPLAGARLEPIRHGQYFWFAWAVFKPDTELRQATADLTPG